MVKNSSILSYVAILLFSLTTSNSAAFNSHIISITDGDTLTALTAKHQQIKVRLYGIDAPEKKQPWGQRSRESLAQLCFDKDADLDVSGHDRYGRTVAVVTCADVNANEVQIGRGMAWVYPQYCKRGFCQEWRFLEGMARENHFGLWADPDPVAPWEWRHPKK